MIHNQLSRLTEVQRAAKIALALDAGAGGLERLDESIQVIKDLWRDPRDRHLMGERSYQGYAEVAAGGAGRYSTAAFHCNSPGWMALLERIEISLAANGQVYIYRGVPQPSGSAYYQPRDTRQLTYAPISGITLDNTALALPAGVICGEYRLLASSPQVVPLDWVFAPGLAAGAVPYRALVVANATANTALEVNFFWRERSLLPGELSL